MRFAPRGCTTLGIPRSVHVLFRSQIPLRGRIVSNFIVQALKGVPITLHRRGKQTRCFCYVDDLNDAFIRLLDLAVTLPAR